MASGIKKRTGSDYSDGRPGRINYHSEDEYRTITLTLQATAEDMHDITHLRDAVNELFDDELMLREMRIKSVEVEYESMGQRTGEMQLGAPEYVNGKQIKVAMVNSPEIDDTALVSTFTVEFETTESPYFETIYTTLELHDSGYDATAEKYGLVDNIDDEKASYRFTPEILTQNVGANAFKNGFLSSTTGQESDSSTNLIITSYVNVVIGNTYNFVDEGWSSAVQYWWIYEYDDNNKFIKAHSFSNKEFDFVPVGKKLKFMAQPYNDNVLKASDVGVSGSGRGMIPLLKRPSTVNSFTVYNAGNVTVEPESMYLDIVFGDVRGDSLTLKNKTTGETLVINAKTTGHVVRQQGMVIYVGGINRFRDTNRRFIRLLPGINEFEVTGSSYERVSVDFKFYYK